jgi:hypothetical protein
MAKPLPKRARRFLENLADGRAGECGLGVDADCDSMARICLVALCRGLICGGGSITRAGLTAIGRAPVDAAASRALH